MKNKVVAFLFLFVLLLGIFLFPIAFPHANVILGTNPIQGNETSSSTITFEFKGVSNVSITNISLYGDWNGSWEENYTNDSYANDTWLNITVGGIPEGNHTWGILSNNSEGYLNWSENRTFVIDYTAPVFSSLSNQTGFSNESFSYDVNAVDSLVGLGNFSLNDTSVFSINFSTGLIENVTSMESGGFYIYNLTVNDTLGNLNWEIFTINISRVHYPMVFLENLADTYNSSSNSVTFEFRILGNTTIDTVYLFGNWNGSWIANYTNGSYSSGDWSNITVSGISEGTYNWSVYANESDGNETWSQNRTFTVDTTVPTITVISPEDSSEYEDSDDIDFIVSTNESCTCQYDVEEAGNVSMTATNSTWFTDTDSFSEDSGDYDVVFYCFDYAGNMVSDSSISFEVPVTSSDDDEDDEDDSSSSSTSTSTLTTTTDEDEEENESLEGTQTFVSKEGQTQNVLEENLNESTEIKFQKSFSKNIKNSMVGNSLFSIEINLKNLKEKIDNSSEILINYTIKDLDGNVHFSGSETTTYEEMDSYYRDFEVGNLTKGEYILEAYVHSADEVEKIQSNFKVRPNLPFVIALLTGIIVLGIAGFFLFFQRIMNSIKNRKYLTFTR